ncbi:RDD family protein [Rubripirellula lacrimiformis]|uniref:RDD family protein n=1 Tax=Rubripirellula lacrimiformis TaxID=1930273 RepID=A0A517NB49_9BACT|nr:RDD family protein [Rubripirellula lacrimiformis]QDT04361.1 RDD family protein [Rubripirellula lacrimiformis]
MTLDRSLGTGAYYELDDYASFSQRVAVMVVDTAVLVVAWVALGIAILTAFWFAAPAIDPSGYIFLLGAAGAWAYLVPLKRSRLRTIGYRLLGLMIVTTKGERPSLFTMTFRMMMWLFGPFNLLLDLIWLGADTEGQSLRDCYAGTYVLRSGARPIGFAPVHLTRYNGAGLSIAYPRVCRPLTDTTDGGSLGTPPTFRQ